LTAVPVNPAKRRLLPGAAEGEVKASQILYITAGIAVRVYPFTPATSFCPPVLAPAQGAFFIWLQCPKNQLIVKGLK
jgi:hypothetical protein